ncbi:DUF924 family protein [Brucella pituitosa]|uniref:DUF924 family protein n=1 Tax=Brucella pituitosa TaxID=571256 RepID=UPI003F4AEC91
MPGKRRVEPDLRLFFCLPFVHWEEIANKDVSLLLDAKLCELWLSHAKGNRDIILRFGRFPHRNPQLGREITTSKASFLREGGFRGRGPAVRRASNWTCPYLVERFCLKFRFMISNWIGDLYPRAECLRTGL